MKTSISETIQIEKYLLEQLSLGQKVLFEARLEHDESLRTKMFFQKVLRRLLRLYHRRKLKQEVAHIHDHLFHDPARIHFRESVLKHFNT